MNPLKNITEKKRKRLIGIMSGTSVDAVDAVLAEICACGINTRFRELAFVSLPYPKGYRDYVLKNSLPGTGSVDTISSLNVLVSHFFSDAVRAVANKAGIPLHSIDAIGSHGQTVHHLPNKQILFGKEVRSTLQLGDPSTLAKRTGIPVVANFRSGDMALGGQGAPLVPYFDFLAFRSKKKNRAVLNIGGIANITLLPKNCTVNNILAFDTGPGNMLIDGAMKKLFGKEFDAGGAIAQRGNIQPKLLSMLLRSPYFRKTPPKSTGREEFGNAFLERALRFDKNFSTYDLAATLTEFTVLTIYHQYGKFLQQQLHGEPLHELIVSGGGSKNNAIMNALKKYFSPASVITSDEAGVSSNSKEALCFAVLANETLSGIPANVPSVTGARSRTILGTISF
ncbi:MAG: anhydro-N-acetylmuramic acid kinase [Bacteroidetes bacterium]|nr:anhydro-N-acetylmuramic acid kinase [Bacteroidota bacterium]